MSKLFKKKEKPVVNEEIRLKNSRLIIKSSRNENENPSANKITKYKTNYNLSSLDESQLRIGFWSTWQVKCGIAIYTEHIYKAFQNIGSAVFGYPHDTPLVDLLKQIDLDKIHVLSIQYELAIMPNPDDLIKFIMQLKERRIKVVMTIHSETPYIQKLLDYVDQIIYHKPPTVININYPKVNVLPMAVPVFDPPRSKKKLRTKYGFAASDKIISTTGFMFTWKQHADILNRLVPYLQNDKNLKVQLLTSINDVNPTECFKELENIKQVIETNNLQSQIVHITDFLSQEELSERLWISDLGYLWSGITTTSSSAAGKEFITARLPLVATNSSHYHDLIKGTIKTNMNKEEFVPKIIEVLESSSLKEMRSELETLYQEINYNNIISKHVEVYKK